LAERNFYIELHAANIVLNSGIPITLVPSDVTNQVLTTNDFYCRLQASQLTPES
jgi:purine nucleosidase